MNYLKCSILGLGLFLSMQSAWADVSCVPTGVIDETENNTTIKGSLCSITTQGNNGFGGQDPLQALQRAITDTLKEGLEACKKQKMVSAGYVTEFNSNSFQVTSIGVINGTKGALATLTGRLLCVEGTGQNTYSVPSAK
jgi:hypothetical protein